MPSLLQVHISRWSAGCNSHHCPTHCPIRTKVCHVRGSVPCDVLFVGEAPGHAERMIGQPFVGPAGKYLDRMIAEAFQAAQVPGTEGPGYNSLRWAFINVVGCMPYNPDNKGKADEPDDDQVIACKPRTEELIRLCAPKLLVCVGKHAALWLTQGMRDCIETPPCQQISITHPAAILRANPVQKPYLRRRAILSLQEAVERMIADPTPPTWEDVPF